MQFYCALAEVFVFSLLLDASMPVALFSQTSNDTTAPNREPLNSINILEKMLTYDKIIERFLFSCSNKNAISSPKRAAAHLLQRWQFRREHHNLQKNSIFMSSHFYSFAFYDNLIVSFL